MKIKYWIVTFLIALIAYFNISSIITGTTHRELMQKEISKLDEVRITKVRFKVDPNNWGAIEISFKDIVEDSTVVQSIVNGYKQLVPYSGAGRFGRKSGVIELMAGDSIVINSIVSINEQTAIVFIPTEASNFIHGYDEVFMSKDLKKVLEKLK